MKKDKFSKWILTFGAIGGVIGMLLAQLLKGRFDLAGFSSALTAAVILISVNIIRNWRKQDSILEFD